MNGGRWHALSTAPMLAHTLVTSGLINRFATLSLAQLSIISSTAVGGGIIGASLFAAALIESGKLDRVHNRLLRGLALWIAPWTMFYLFAAGPLRPLSPRNERESEAIHDYSSPPACGRGKMRIAGLGRRVTPPPPAARG